MALLPLVYINSVVAIGTRTIDSKTAWFASGFLYGHQLVPVDQTRSIYNVYLITNRHVLEKYSNIILRFNPQDNQPAREFPINFSENDPAIRLYHPTSSIDLGAVSIDPNFLRSEGIQFNFFQSQDQVANRELATEEGLFEGDFCYLLGFPLAQVGEQRNYVIARHGTIAKISDFLRGHSDKIIIDCMNFPGNSGGPVVTKPDSMTVQDTRSPSMSYLLGIVRSYIPFRDVCISEQTGEARIVFVENSGLAEIVPAHFLKEWIASLPQNQLTQEQHEAARRAQS